MLLSISNIAWDEENEEKVLQILKDFKYAALEVAPTRIIPSRPYENLQIAQNYIDDVYSKYKLRISSIQSIWFGKSENIFRTREERNVLIEYTKQAILFAQGIGAHNLVFGCPRNRNKEMNSELALESVMDFFKEVGEYSHTHDTVFSLEANPTIYNTNFINTTAEAFDLVRLIDCPGIKVNLDLGTMIYNNEDLDILKGNVKYINHVHISEPNLEMIKMRSCHTLLKEILLAENYKGYISIEMKNYSNLENIYNVVKYIRDIFD